MGALAAGTALVAVSGEDVVVVVRTSAETATARAVLAAVGAAAAGSARVVAGPVVGRLDQAGRSLARARQALELADTLGLAQRCLAAAQLTAPLLLASLRPEPLAVQLVGEEIGPLVAHDRAAGTDLVGTLRPYLAHSSSKVRAAAALRIRRADAARAARPHRGADR